MAEVTEVRESGVELLDTELDETHEDAEAVHVRAEDSVQIQVGESAGNPVLVEAQYFIVASVEGETDEITEMMTGETEIDEASVFISNEEGEVGGGFIQIEEGDIDDALTELEAEHL